MQQSIPLRQVEVRPLRVDADRNRKAILAAADRLFAERGFDVPLADIAAAAGVGRATLHRNFPTRVDLAFAIVARNMQEIRTFAAGQTGTPDDLEELIDIKLGYYVRSTGLAEAARTGLIDTDFASEHAEVAELMLRAAGPAIAAGRIRPDVTADTFFVLQLAMGGVLQGGGTDEDRWTRAREFKDLFLNGLRHR